MKMGVSNTQPAKSKKQGAPQKEEDKEGRTKKKY
jgi:hypothetical protein